jgi:hypothetical protein
MIGASAQAVSTRLVVAALALVLVGSCNSDMLACVNKHTVMVDATAVEQQAGRCTGTMDLAWAREHSWREHWWEAWEVLEDPGDRAQAQTRVPGSARTISTLQRPLVLLMLWEFRSRVKDVSCAWDWSVVLCICTSLHPHPPKL